MQTYLSVALIVISLGLIFTILLQVKGGGLGGIFGQPDTVFRTKRGIEKTLYQLTVALMIIFIIVSIIALRVG